MTSKQIRDLSAATLKNNISQAIAASVIICAFYALFIVIADELLVLFDAFPTEDTEPFGLPAAVKTAVIAASALVFVLSSIFAVMPISVGVKKLFYKTAAGEKSELSTVFSDFSKGQYGRTVDFCARLFVKKLLWAALFMLPGVLIRAAEFAGQITQGQELSFAFGMPETLCVIGLIVSKFFCARYFAAPYLFAINESISPSEAISESVRLMKGKTGSLEALVFSHTAWLLLSVPTVGISLIYTVPRYFTALAIFAKELNQKTI